MKLAEFDLLEAKVAGLLKLHRDLTSENRRLRLKLEEQSRELARLREDRERTLQLKQTLLGRIDQLLGDAEE
jgi:hypothetical protein